MGVSGHLGDLFHYLQGSGGLTSLPPLISLLAVFILFVLLSISLSMSMASRKSTAQL